ncbi:acyl carrier protein [Helicobacter sp. 13S00477-4]|uniref:acyl carrier protein n=1 Tax=Helicobacter sp. 13S00477-4 TaxID=1905759 RepID=UPI000BA7C259|nr:acyl carrier protein [Helicobacter sp. 13S00477-4]PAF51512.1 hypothetical protein BKH44_05570 [Helicobacter sp. 13S00477-4]
MEKIYMKLQDILDTESINDTDVLEDFEDWDSLSIITLITFLDKEYNIVLYTNEIKSAKTIGDLLQIIQKKKQ